MAKKKIQRFKITTPDIRTIYIGRGHSQKVRYLKLSEGIPETALDEDINAGAHIYESFTEVLKQKATQYNIITAPSLEDGMRAVAYLENIFGDVTDFEEYPDDQYEEPLSMDDIDICDLIDDEDDVEEYGYRESSGCIPMINLDEVKFHDQNNRSNGGFGVFNMEMMNNGNKARPWWADCTEKPVCIIKDSSLMFMGGFQPVQMFEDEIDCLKRFSSNERVYFLMVSESIREDDYSITTVALEYTANVFRVNDKPSVKNEYYRLLLKNVAESRGFTFSKNVDTRLLAEKLGRIDRRNPCREYEKIMNYLIHIDASKCLKNSDFDKLGLSKLIEKAAVGDTLGTLDENLVGMTAVKKQINTIMNMMRYAKLRAGRDIKNSCFHNVYLFVGAPGTAKTTVAKMLTEMMQKEGLIEGNRFISVTGAQLKGAYVGQTAPRVHALFQNHDAIFIDEAYSLTCSNGEDPDSYSQEALAQLAVELEEHATDKLVIFAGYGGKNVSKKNNLMYKFLQANPGISSRINSTVYFDSYAPEDMVSIIHRLAEISSLKLSDEYDNEISEYFRSRQDAEDFGNGREARMFLEHCECCIADRIAGRDPSEVSDKILSTVRAEDVRHTIEELKEKKMNEAGRFGNRMGFAV